MSQPAPASASEIGRAFIASCQSARAIPQPYPHYLMGGIFPDAVAAQVTGLPFKAPALEGESGRRELHNETRSYFDAASIAQFPVVAEIAAAFQSREVAQAVSAAFDAPIDGTYLRLEYAMDTNGFWLEPHTDLGVKKFTCLIYLSEGHEDLGTDIYADRETHVERSPFLPNTAMAFVPSDRTWHGFEKRPIQGVRKSLILNYVTPDWRAREQLSFPDTLVRV
ncbi:MAG: hypothetical protein JWN93_445 [Hyphomicrobiales bacterium]|nr:hypothetical protein [Hyphomicrobiales bacterium]